MAFKLTKQEIVLRAALAPALRAEAEALSHAVEDYNTQMGEAWTALAEAVDAYNAASQEAWADVEPKLNAYNESLGEAREMVESVKEERGEALERRSEKWQRSAKGDAVKEWLGAFMECSLDPVELEPHEAVELEQPSDLELDWPEPEHAEQVENLPDAPEEVDDED